MFLVEEARCQVLLGYELFEEGFAIAAGGLAISGCVADMCCLRGDEMGEGKKG